MTPPRRRYPTDLTDAQWALLAPLIPPAKLGGSPAIHDRRELVDAMLYLLRAGCAWRLLPHDFPPWRTVYHYWRVWRRQGVWETRAWGAARAGADSAGPQADPRCGDPGQPERADHRKGGPHGYDGAKRLNGRKRHLLVDTLGLICKAHVTAANVSDRDGARGLLRRLDWRRFPRVQHGWVDQGYRGEFLTQVKQRYGVTLEVVVRRDVARGGAGCHPEPSRRRSQRLRWRPAGGWWSAPSAGWAVIAVSARITSSCRRPPRPGSGSEQTTPSEVRL